CRAATRRSWSRRWRLRRGSGSYSRSRRRCGRNAARPHRLAFRRGEIGTKRFPRLCAVARDENAVVADVQRLRLERDVETLPEITVLGVKVSVRAEIRCDVAPLPGRKIDLDEPVALARAIAVTVHGRGLEWIGYDGAEL